MSLFTVQARNDLPWYKFTNSLSEVIYTMRFRFNTRSNRWLLDIADAADNDILVGIPILIERNLTGQYVIAGLPPGILYAVDDTNQDTQPERFSFGLDHSLIYSDGL